MTWGKKIELCRKALGKGNWQPGMPPAMPLGYNKEKIALYSMRYNKMVFLTPAECGNRPSLIKTGLFDDWMHFFGGRYGIRPENEVLFAAQTWIIDKANKMEGKYKELI